MRRDDLYLRDILEAADHISDFIKGLDAFGFEQTEVVRSAVVQKLTTIGEACARISPELKAAYPEIPWPRIIAFRNILVHACFGIDWSEVWLAASRQVPRLRDQIASVRPPEDQEA
jgi:uncharacterized protein with HEPN domain